MNWLGQLIQEEVSKEDMVISFGCGILQEIEGIKCKSFKGIDIYEPYINQLKQKGYDVDCKDITKVEYPENSFDIVLALDILEHLKYEELDEILNNVSISGNKFLFSIPFEGDPNLEADPTHIIKEDKEWWIEKLSKYFKMKDAPNDWLFHEQILIGEKNDK